MKIRIAIMIAMTAAFALAPTDQASAGHQKKKTQVTAARVTGCLPPAGATCGHCRPLSKLQPISVWVWGYYDWMGVCHP
jgi:hypothetical protein